ncbi:MAG: hydrogenase maturation protease [Armatimonadetes bacterium]|nr:hydrogenase maturation protease [Armatimonadota bacterium]
MGDREPQWAELIRGPVLVVGVGNEYRLDDGVGLEVARLVEKARVCPVLLAEEVPENYLGPICSSGAETVIFCDAVDLKQPPGTWAFVLPESLAGADVSTHNPSLRLLADVLRAQGIGSVLIAAVQPLCIGWGRGLSEPVRQAAQELAAELVEMISSCSKS